MKRAYADTPEGQIHYQTAGNGEPLLLLHQTPFSSDEYSKIIPILCKSYWIVAMDTLGYGNSDKPPQGYSIEDYVRNIIHFLDTLGIKKTSVYGHHTGATLAVELASTYPERVDKLILSGSSLYSLEESEAFLNNPRFAPMEVTEDGAFLKHQWEYCWTMSPYMNLEIAYKIFVANMLVGPRLHDAHYAAFRYNKAPKLPLIKSPTLAIAGTEDLFIQKQETVASLIPRCKTEIIQGAGNICALEKPDEVANAILDFLENPGV